MAQPINGVCRSCGAPIIWLRTTNDKPIPVDFDSVKVIPTDKLFNPAAGMVSHFKTCPDASKWSKPKPKKVEQANLL